MTLTLEQRANRRDLILDAYKHLGVNSTTIAVRKLAIEHGLEPMNRSTAQAIINEYRHEPLNGIVFMDFLDDDVALEMFATVIPATLTSFNKPSLLRVMNEHKMLISGWRLFSLWGDYKRLLRQRKMQKRKKDPK